MQDSLPADGLRLCREGVEPLDHYERFQVTSFPPEFILSQGLSKPFGGPEGVLAHLSRYTHRVAIANSRLLTFDDKGVPFKCKDYRIEGPGRPKTMTLATDEFIRRFLIHIPPRGFHRIRHYGLLAKPSSADNIARARQLQYR